MPSEFTIEQIAAAIKQREPKLKDVPDAELVRKVLERRPDLLGVMKRSEPRRPIGSMYEQIGARLKSDLNIPRQLQGAANAVHTGLANIREGGPSQLPAFWDALKQYKNPSNVIADLLAAGILGKLTGMESVETRAPLRGEPLRTPATSEAFMDTVTRRAPGEPPGGSSLAQQRSLVDNLRMRFNQQKAAGDPGMWTTASKLKEVEASLREAELAQWGESYKKSPQQFSKEGGGGANYSADDLAAFKKKWGIQ